MAKITITYVSGKKEKFTETDPAKIRAHEARFSEPSVESVSVEG